MGYSTTTITVLYLSFILSYLLLSQDLHVHARDSADERPALLEFRKAIENSKVLSNWNDSIQHCHWIGISCKQGRVWKDVDGVLTCDPNIYPNAIPVPHLTFEEAVELAYFGAQNQSLARTQSKSMGRMEFESHKREG
ncbi:hypothetical protein Cni_G16583 [Canna indica]|uniref:Leucine-rich repeat-containing N-terminal plant-type domain-containing protein n=1 Tax=Canna indica TaxID=4628 RepID=A0AAQ3KGA9_9LILI|nr:hypothetical protein Cni_G16583 [Canna indica]